MSPTSDNQESAGNDPGMLGLFTVLFYLAFTPWLILTGTALLHGEARAATA